MPDCPSASFLFRRIIPVLSLIFYGSGMSHGYTTVVASTSAPAGVEAQFIAATTTQFNATVTTNPFFAGTFSVTLYGPNPSYNAPITNTQLLQQIDLDSQYMATVDSYTYANGWGNGESYQQYQDININDGFIVNCDSPTAWNVAIDTTTCYAVLNAMQGSLYQESLSTPTVVPGDFQ